MSVYLDMRPLRALERKLKSVGANLEIGLKKNDEEFSSLLLKEVISRASGRPGPNIVTGQYVRSFFLIDGRVVNPSPQTRRLEYGYVGTDSIGRVYHQPAFPHFRPALAALRPKYVASIPQVFWKAWGQS